VICYLEFVFCIDKWLRVTCYTQPCKPCEVTHILHCLPRGWIISQWELGYLCAGLTWGINKKCSFSSSRIIRRNMLSKCPKWGEIKIHPHWIGSPATCNKIKDRQFNCVWNFKCTNQAKAVQSHGYEIPLAHRQSKTILEIIILNIIQSNITNICAHLPFIRPIA
jgi:hypothetical protein